MTTPLAARLPYKAVAAAPFKIVMFATSSGLIALAPFPKSYPLFKPSVEYTVELFKGTPSTTYSGWLVPESELTPRIMTELEAPGSDEVLEICTPAILPAKLDITSDVRLSAIFSPPTEVAA